MPHQQPPEGYLSVTETLDLCINKKFLQYWRGKIGNQQAEMIMKESQKIGTEVHKQIEWMFNGFCRTISEPIPREVVMMQNFYDKFVNPYDVRHKALEVTLQDKKLKLQGTFDAVIDSNKWNDVTADWKTSSSIDKVSVPLQLAAYDYLRNGSGKGVVVRIDKETDQVEVKWYDDLKQYWPIFKAAIKLARFIKLGEV